VTKEKQFKKAEDELNDLEYILKDLVIGAQTIRDNKSHLGRIKEMEKELAETKKNLKKAQLAFSSETDRNSLLSLGQRDDIMATSMDQREKMMAATTKQKKKLQKFLKKP